MKHCFLTEKEVMDYMHFPLFSKDKAKNGLMCQQVNDNAGTSYFVLDFEKDQEYNSLTKLACIINEHNLSLNLKNGEFTFNTIDNSIRFNNRIIFITISRDGIGIFLKAPELYLDDIHKGFLELITERLNNSLKR